MVQSVVKLFEHLLQFVPGNSNLMQFYEINVCQIMIFGLFAVYKRHEMIKIGSQTREKLQVLE